MPGIPAVPKNSAHRDHRKAADVPTEMSVSIVAAPCRALVHAARWKGQAAYVTTGAASVSDSHCQYSNWSAGTMAIAMTGTARTVAVTSRCRSDTRAGSSGAPDSGGSSSRTGGAGSSAVYPVFSTVAMRSATAVLSPS
ncbi:hypothetical protein GCM10018987_28790 [Streptomyces cremeus]